MAHYTRVIKEILTPEDSFKSVIDTFDSLGQMLETYDKVRANKVITPEDIQRIMFYGMFTMNFYPFWQAHGAVMRPLLIKAMQQNERSSVEAFFEDALPTALTFLMPNKQLEFSQVAEMVRRKFKE